MLDSTTINNTPTYSSYNKKLKRVRNFYLTNKSFSKNLDTYRTIGFMLLINSKFAYIFARGRRKSQFTLLCDPKYQNKLS